MQARQPHRRASLQLSTRKKWAFRLVAISLVVVLGILGAELYIRLDYTLRASASLDQVRKSIPHDRQQDIKLGDMITPTGENDIIYRLKPNALGRSLGNTVEFNSEGYRDTPLLAKRKGDWNIVVLGDSNSFGWGVEHHEIWTERLEQALQNLAPQASRVNVINTAVPGYNARMQVSLFMEDRAKLQPDAVLLQYCNNDTVLPSFIVKKNFLTDWNRLYLWELVKGTTFQYGLSFTSQNTMRKWGTYDVMDRDRVPAQYRHHLGIESLRQAYSELRDYCQAQGLPLRVILISEVVLPQSPGLKRNPDYDGIRPHLEALRIETLDTFPETQAFALQEGLRSEMLAIDAPADWHPNAIRHLIMAWAVLPDCARMLWPQISEERIESEKSRLKQIARSLLDNRGKP